MRVEARKRAKYDAVCAATRTIFQPFALETTGEHGAAAVYFLFTMHMSDLGLPADVLVGKFKKLRRGTIAQVA